jgi:hypothetical protein
MCAKTRVQPIMRYYYYEIFLTGIGECKSGEGHADFKRGEVRCSEFGDKL